MLKVTAAARTRLLRKLEHEHAADDVALRFTRKENGWRLQHDRLRPDDKAFAHEGRNILLVEEAVAKAMDALTLDVRKTKSGPRFKLRRIRRPEQ